ncbi:C3a anaphylatoxin chemotactic receptor-like [Hypanus sabinus]|uniref:C3a anaphylatoxin chemotactic receptor-like n=1 Tax=Hypanus sabinus TaxID=79690 RepID=UPI0028C44067|nr:C3a anaphylatoxin chemotactic receptor-like [Hypanus sabinus]
MIPYAITFLLGVPGNSAVIWVTGFKMERNIHIMSFLYLAVADLTYCLTLPFWMANVAQRGTWLRNDILYMLPLGSIIFSGSVSVFMLTLISIFRCLAVTRPLWFHQHNSLRWAHVTFLGVCGFSILLCMTALLYIKLEPDFDQKTWEMMRVIWAVFIFVFPVLIMTACCAFIGWRLHRDKFVKSKKPVRLMMTVVAAFIASWLPLHSCSFAMLFFNYSFLIWNDVATAVACFSSALNPFLYVFTGRDFRQVFRRSLASSLRLAFSEEEPEMRNDPPSRTNSL